ncbi:MAG: dTDP-4-dehydrorhamnose reductase [Pedosphaera sp.]|nr:dTDP-4-dehydrorhamnose reductase [Pedosphaera sp.]
MKILVIGGSGLIGSHVLRAAAAAGHAAVGTYREFPQPGLVALDCADTAGAVELLDREKPDAVVHAAGWAWVDGCEDNPNRAIAENATQPAQFAALCNERKIHFAWFSSSYVFDGVAGPYLENAPANPINVYGRSKWEGEHRVQAACAGEALIARVICVYGAEKRGKNFAYQVWRALREGKTLTLPADQCGNPSYAGDIARWLVALLERRERGIWHLAGPQPDCTRPEWAGKLVAAFAATGVVAQPNFAIKTQPTAELKQRALRPLRAGIISSRTAPVDFKATDFNESIRELVSQNKNL